MKGKNIYETLIADITKRIKGIHRNSPLFALREAKPDARMLLDCSIPTICRGCVRKQPLVKCAEITGRQIRRKMDIEMDDAEVIRAGLFVLESYQNAGMMELSKDVVKSSDKHPSHNLYLRSRRKLMELLKFAPPKIEGMHPVAEPYARWTGGRHANGRPVVKYASNRVLSAMKPRNYPVPFDCINKFQDTGWRINEEMLGVVDHAADNESSGTYQGEYSALSYILETDKTAKASKRTEVDIIRKMARSLGSEPFYHQYQFDFRGRVYPTTAFLHEQGSDNAKGLLLMEHPKPLGKYGHKWLKVQAANYFGEDKLRIEDRVAYTDDHLSEFIDYATSPFVNKHWMTADYPLQFLATCMELWKIERWVNAGNEAETYLCAVVVYFDGSNNGTQWLTAMARDHASAELVNLLPSQLPGDVYTFISDKVWDKVAADYDPALDDAMEEYSSRLQSMGKQIDAASKKEKRGAALNKSIMREMFRSEDPNAIRKLAANFWMAVPQSQRRAVVKRPVMTMAYAATRHGFASQIMEDTKQISKRLRYMDIAWASYLANVIYDSCEQEMEGPTQLMALFQNICAIAVADGRKFEWIVPETGFPVIQNYKKREGKYLNYKWCGSMINIKYFLQIGDKIDKRAQKNGASANIVHSLDASHVHKYAASYDYPTPTVHDSFGCNAADAETAFNRIRLVFADIVLKDPLLQILQQHNAEHLMPARGNLDIRKIMNSEFAFS